MYIIVSLMSINNVSTILILFLVVDWKVSWTVESRVLVLVRVLGLMGQLQLGYRCPGEVGVGRGPITAVSPVLLVATVSKLLFRIVSENTYTSK